MNVERLLNTIICLFICVRDVIETDIKNIFYLIFII